MSDGSNNENNLAEDHKQVGIESLRYHPSKVSWAMSQHISRENPKIHRVLVYVIIGILFLALTYSLVTKIAISIRSAGKLDFDANTISVVNNNDIIVDKIFFKDNDPVKKNDVLLIAKNRSPTNLLRNYQADAEAVFKIVENEKNKSCDKQCIKVLEEFSNLGFAKTENLDLDLELPDYLRQVSTDLNSYISALKNSGNAPATLSGLKLRLSQAESKLVEIRKRKAEQLLAMEVENLKKEIADINSQINEKKIGNSNQVETARSALQLSLKPIREKLITYKRNHELRSPTDGILKFETLGGEGELISGRTKVFQIIPTNSDLIAKILVQNKDISEIALKDLVKISLQALPEREFGSLQGKIKKISVNPVEDKQTGSLNYEVLVSLNRQKLVSSFGEEKPLKLGMTLDAKIITKHKTLFWVGVSKLLNIKQEYLGELF